MKRHLVLVGLPGAGKSEAGRRLAVRLDSHLSDIDLVLARATGLSVADQFAETGEADFRVREHQAVLDALLLPPHVIAPGGGWAARPGHLSALGDLGVAVYLDVDPVVAAGRLARDPSIRPLLAATPLSAATPLPPATPLPAASGTTPSSATSAAPDDLIAKLAQLARDRGRWYQQAPVTIDVSQRTADEVADLLLEVARAKAGW